MKVRKKRERGGERGWRIIGVGRWGSRRTTDVGKKIRSRIAVGGGS